MVINNENKRNISMYKQANPTPTVDPNDANNSLPAALMLGAIGGVAGLGGSLLSKKQRKHKLRNTLLGATALPAAFLAANKWGPEAVKGKLNDFSGNVYKGYEDYIAPRVPKAMSEYIGSSAVNTNKDVETAYNKAQTAYNKKNDAEVAAFENRKRGPVLKDTSKLKKPVYSGVKEEAVTSAKDAMNTAKAKNEEAKKQIEIQNRLKADTEGNISTAYNQYLDALNNLQNPEETDAYKDLSKTIAELDIGKRNAVIAQLEEDLNNGSLDAKTSLAYRTAKAKTLGSSSAKRRAQTDLGAAKSNKETTEKIIADLKTELTNYDKTKSEIDAESKKAEETLAQIEAKLKNKNLILKDVDPTLSNEITWRKQLQDLANSEKKEDVDKLLSLLEKVDDANLATYRGNLASAEEGLKPYSTANRENKLTEIRNQLEEDKKKALEDAYLAEVQTASLMGSDTDNIEDPTTRFNKWIATPEYQKAVDEQIRQFDSQAEGRVAARDAARKQLISQARQYALDQGKGLKELYTKRDDAVKDIVKDLNEQAGTLRQRVKNPPVFDPKVRKQKVQELEKARGALEGYSADMLKQQKALEAAEAALSKAYDEQPWFKQLVDDYVKTNIDPKRQQLEQMVSDFYAKREGADNSYFNSYQGYSSELADIASRINELSEAQKDYDAKQRAYDDLKKQFDIDQEAFAKSKKDYEDSKKTMEAENSIVESQWPGEQAGLENVARTLGAEYAKADKAHATAQEAEANRRRKRQNTALAATGGGAGLIVLLSALNKLRKRKKKEISPEEYLNYLEEEGMA